MFFLFRLLSTQKNSPFHFSSYGVVFLSIFVHITTPLSSHVKRRIHGLIAEGSQVQREPTLGFLSFHMAWDVRSNGGRLPLCFLFSRPQLLSSAEALPWQQYRISGTLFFAVVRRAALLFGIIRSVDPAWGTMTRRAYILYV